MARQLTVGYWHVHKVRQKQVGSTSAAARSHETPQIAQVLAASAAFAPPSGHLACVSEAVAAVETTFYSCPECQHVRGDVVMAAIDDVVAEGGDVVMSISPGEGAAPRVGS